MQIKNYCIAERKRFLTDGIVINKIIFVYDKFSDMRRKNVRNHVRFDDYFITLATILNCIRQAYEEIEKDQAEKIISVNGQNLKRLENLKNDLIFLQDNFTIVKKKK